MPKALRIAIIGPEASGKTELAKFLAEKFGGTATEEYARIYFATHQLPADHELSASEMRDVMRGQSELEQGQGLLMIDASCIHGAVYSALERREALLFDYAAVDAEVMAYAIGGDYDAIILCQPHAALEWVDDGMRAMPELEDRHAFAASCHEFISQHYASVPVIMIDGGSWEARERQAIEKLKKIL